MIQAGKINVATEMMKVEYRFTKLLRVMKLDDPAHNIAIIYKPSTGLWHVQTPFGMERSGKDLDDLLERILPSK